MFITLLLNVWNTLGYIGSILVQISDTLISGDIRSPNSGQPVILAEKCEENSYTLIEPPAPPQPDRLSVNGQNHSKPPRESNSSSIEEMATANNTSSNSNRQVSPSIEPFIPERV